MKKPLLIMGAIFIGIGLAALAIAESGVWASGEDEYLIPISFTDTGWNDVGARLADVNSDGLADILKGYAAETQQWRQVYINNGAGKFLLDVNYVLPVVFIAYGPTHNYDMGVRIIDANGDGFPDLARSYQNSFGHQSQVYINKKDGTGWVLDTNYAVPIPFAYLDGGDTLGGVDFGDVNGDGLTDIIYSSAAESGRKVYLNQGDGTGWK